MKYPINIKVDGKARKRLVQEVLFSYGWEWGVSGKMIKDYHHALYFILYDPKAKKFGSATSSRMGFITSEEILANSQEYLYDHK